MRFTSFNHRTGRLGYTLAAGSLGLSCLEAAPVPSVGPDHPVNEWVRQSPREGAPAPNFPYEGSGAFNPETGQWIHHAGHDGIPQGFHTFTFDLESGRWEQHFPPTSPPGVCCVDGANVFDLANRRFVRIPGGSLGHGFQWSRGVRLKESAIWLYEPGQRLWTNMRPPPYKEPEKYSKDVIGGLCSGGAYAPTHELVLSFGGTGAGGAKHALFVYDTYANALQQLRPANPPPARDGMGLAYDAGHDKLVLFGSQYLSDERTWLYDFQANAWEALELDPHPPGKKTGTYSTIPKMAYDSHHGLVLCLVWLDAQGHETWLFDTGKRAWTKMNPAVEPAPSKSRSRNLSYSAPHNLFILETSSTANRPEIWTYRYKNVSAPAPPVPPTGLEAVTGPDSVRLGWTAPATGPVREYRVYRARPDQPWQARFERIGSTTAPSFEDRNLEPGTIFHYHVKAVGPDGAEGPASFRARTQPRVPPAPVVSVLATNRVEIRWDPVPAPDRIGFNLYRGMASVRSVLKGEAGAWKDNDPAYDEPRVVKVTDLTGLQKLNVQPLTERLFIDPIDLSRQGSESGDYKFAVYAYVLKAVNRLGVESGPSPYALTLPSEPLNVLCRERGEVAELKWDPNPEQGITGYRLYKLGGTFEILPLTPEPIPATTYEHHVGRGKRTRFWVVAVDALGQEGQPSSPAWFNQSYRGFYEGDWHP